MKLQVGHNNRHYTTHQAEILNMRFWKNLTMLLKYLFV